MGRAEWRNREIAPQNREAAAYKRGTHAWVRHALSSSDARGPGMLQQYYSHVYAVRHRVSVIGGTAAAARISLRTASRQRSITQPRKPSTG